MFLLTWLNCIKTCTTYAAISAITVSMNRLLYYNYWNTLSHTTWEGLHTVAKCHQAEFMSWALVKSPSVDWWMFHREISIWQTKRILGESTMTASLVRRANIWTNVHINSELLIFTDQSLTELHVGDGCAPPCCSLTLILASSQCFQGNSQII